MKMKKKAKSEREQLAEMQEALKDIFGSMFEEMLQGEMNVHLGYGR